MRKALLMGILVAVLMGMVTYGIVWWMQASHAREVTQEAIARLNDGHEILTYAAIETHGFPLSLRVDVVKPRIQGRIDQLLKGLAAKLPEGNKDREKFIAMADHMPGWVEDITLDGRVSFSVNWKSDQFRLEVIGQTHSKSTLPDTGFELQTQPQGPITCEVELSHLAGGMFDSMWDFRLLARNFVETAIQTVHIFSCEFPAYVMVQLPDNGVVMRSGASHLKIINTMSDPSSLNLDLDMLVHDSEILPAADRIITAYSKVLAPEHAELGSSNWAALGKQNAEIKATYVGPADFSTEGKDATIAFKVPIFSVSNALYQNDIRLSLANEAKGDSRTLSVNFMSQGSSTEQYDRLLAGNLRVILHELKESQGANGQSLLPESLRSYPADELLHIFESAIPRLHEFGTVRIVGNLDFRGNRAMTQGTLDLRQLLLQASPYSIKFSGGVTLAAQNSLVPNGSLNIEWNNSIRMIDDITAYMDRLEKVVFMIDKDAAKNFHVEPKLVLGAKSFVSALAIKPEGAKGDASALQFNINSDAAKGITVNNKSMDEVSALLNRYLGDSVNGLTLPKVNPAP